MKKKQYNPKQNMRYLLYWLLIGAALALIGTVWYSWWIKIPRTIRIKSGVEQTLDFHVPASGELSLEAVQASDFGKGTIMDSVKIDLSEKITLKASALEKYEMNVKLFGVLPLKQVNIEVIQDTMVIPAGIPIGIYVETDGVLVIGVGEFKGQDGLSCAPSKYVLQEGDYILRMNGREVEGKQQFMKWVEENGQQEMILTVRRGAQQLDLKVTPLKNQNGESKLGIWIRDNAQGIGTLTFVDEQGHFGALGHGINDVDTSNLMALGDGILYHTDIISIKKGSSGSPGELTGMISYSDRNVIGTITDNTVEGIFGTCNASLLSEISQSMLPIGLKQEIELGKAQILCTLNGQPDYYDVEITEVRLDHDNVNRGIVLKITDPELLSLTGGIVQGMSGSPIIQNGKMIGAVTHVLVQDSAKGYGIFIENMLSH